LRRAAAVGVPDVAERLFRILLLRSLLAGFPPHGLPPRRPRLRSATAPVRQVASLCPAPASCACLTDSRRPRRCPPSRVQSEFMVATFPNTRAGTDPGAEPG